MAQRMQQGSPSWWAAQNIAGWRNERGISAEQLAQAVRDAGLSSMNRTILANIENHRRSDMSIEEVLAFARVLNVSPADLIMPRNWHGDGRAQHDEGFASKALVAVTETERQPAGFVRSWIVGDGPLGDDPAGPYFQKAPTWRRRLEQAGLHPLTLAISGLQGATRDAILGPEERVSPRGLAGLIRSSLDRVNRYATLLAEELEERPDADDLDASEGWSQS